MFWAAASWPTCGGKVASTIVQIVPEPVVPAAGRSAVWAQSVPQSSWAGVPLEVPTELPAPAAGSSRVERPLDSGPQDPADAAQTAIRTVANGVGEALQRDVECVLMTGLRTVAAHW